MDFNEANKTVHPVETQWHYPIMTKHGFVAETKEAVGFVRNYVYKHADGRVIRCTTGSSASFLHLLLHTLSKSETQYCECDYWIDDAAKAQGYWASLEKHISR